MVLTSFVFFLNLLFQQGQLHAQTPTPTPSPASEKITARIVSRSDSGIVKWDSETVEVTLNPSLPGGAGFEAELSGKFTDKGTGYLINFKPAKINSEGAFRYKLYLRNENTDLKVTQVQDDGKLKEGEFAITVTIVEWASAKKMLDSAQRKPWGFVLGLGGTSMNYTQNNSSIGNLSSIALTVKGGVDYFFRASPWQVGVFGFYNALPLSGNGSSGLTKFQFFGLNLRGGRSVPWLKAPWELTLLGGWYYLTMMTNGTFGFQHIGGPQLYPAIKYRFPNSSYLQFYVKYSPISQYFTLLSLTNYEIATGLQYVFAKKTKIQFSVYVDYSNVTLTTLDTIGLTTTATANSITLGVAAAL